MGYESLVSMQCEILGHVYQCGTTVYVPGYKTLYIAMIVLGLVLSTALAEKKGLPIFKFYVATVLICILAFTGGRVYFILRDFDLTMASFLPNVLSSHGTASAGAYIGGVLGAYVTLKLLRIDVLVAFDTYTPAMALSLFIGRIGCFMGGCCFGKPSKLPWAVTFPPNTPAYSTHRASEMIPNDALSSLPVHPTQMYEALFGITSLAVLLWLIRKNNADGLLFFTYIGCYAGVRFIIEWLRGDDRGLLVGLSFPQIFSITFLAVGLFGVVYVFRRKRDSCAQCTLS